MSRGKWQYFDHGRWNDYSPADSTVVEQSFLRGHPRSQTAHHDINFQIMQQSNRKTQRTRSVQRILTAPLDTNFIWQADVSGTWVAIPEHVTAIIEIIIANRVPYAQVKIFFQFFFFAFGLVIFPSLVCRILMITSIIHSTRLQWAILIVHGVMI